MFRNRTRTRIFGAREAAIMAVAALDDLVNDLVKASCLKMSPAFLDWVADEATPLVERHVVRSFGSPRFTGSLQIGDPKIAMARWVRHWVCPWIVVNFDELAAYLPEFADSRPAGLMASPRPVAAPKPQARPCLGMPMGLAGAA
ncbi:MAG: hypothetical protein V4646_03355 [Pseudomonadota bacterium]